VPEARRVEGLRRVARQIGQRGHGEVDHEAAAGREVRAHAGEEGLDVLARVEVKDGVEGAKHQRKAAPEPGAPHVASHHAHPVAHLFGLALEALAQIAQHGRRVIDADHLDPVSRDGESDPPVAHAVLQHRALRLPRQSHVERDVGQAPGVRRRVVRRVLVVRERARFELPVARATTQSPYSRLLRAAMYSTTAEWLGRS